MQIRVDLHCHGPSEWLDSKRWNSIEIAKSVAGKLDAVGIAEMGFTEHIDNRFEDLKYNSREDEKMDRVQISGTEIYVPAYGVLLFRTQEVRTYDKNGRPEGHVLVFGNKEKIAETSLDEVLDKANEQEAGVIADHAFSGGDSAMLGVCYANSVDRILKYFEVGKIHAMEYNGAFASRGLLEATLGLRKKNKIAVDFAYCNNLKLTSNTDAHSGREMAKSHNIFQLDSLEPSKYLNRICSTIRDKKSIVEPIMIPGPVFCLDNHAIHIGSIRLMQKLGLGKKYT